MTNREGVISVRAAAGQYDVDRTTLVRWIAAGKLEPIKFPRDRRTYVRRADLERLLAASPGGGRGRPGGWRRRASSSGSGEGEGAKDEGQP